MTDRTLPCVVHYVAGSVVEGGDVDHGAFRAPAIDVDQLYWPRHEPCPAADVKTAEIIDLLDELGRRLDLDTNPYLQEALEASLTLGNLDRRILENSYRGLDRVLNRESLQFTVDRQIGEEYLDGWVEVPVPGGRTVKIRAYPPRLVHIVAGNAPMITAQTVAWGGLTKGVHLLKLPSNDPFTAAAVLRTLAEIEPGHPLARSFSAVYWRGGDESIEGVLFRAQFFDKIAAWGGDAAIRGAMKYVGPGFHLVSFDPKVSMSVVGRGSFASPELMADSAERAAIDATVMNQDACAASRFIYAEGTMEELTAWCALLARELAVDRPTSSGRGRPTPPDIRQEAEALAELDDEVRLFGDFEGSGLVILSPEPVEFTPEAKTVNVVQVASVADAVRFANVATQTVGVYPASVAEELRDGLAAVGVQRMVTLGEVSGAVFGLPHDGFYPVHQFVRWLVCES